MIYLDHNASSPLRPEALQAMQPWLTGPAANPASAHAAGRRARRALEDARDQIAQHLGCASDEVVFTSGATESNNLALFGLVAERPAHLITSPVEHPCVTEPLAQLGKQGYTVDFLPVDGNGVVQASRLPGLIRSDTCLITTMLANHETGAIQPISKLTSLLPPEQSIAFHCDAAQAAGKIQIDFGALQLTSLSASSHKFGGPPGVGILLLNRCARFHPLLFGGHQQRGRRPGTEPVALIVGMAAALDAGIRGIEASSSRLLFLRQRFFQAVSAGASPCVLNGPMTGGLPHVLNLSFPGCRGDALMMALDLAGVCCSTGSACSSGSLLPSPVLKAMGIGGDRLQSAIRFSLSSTLSDQEIDEAASLVIKAVFRLREVPLED